jgi:hypothetical protein
MSYATLFARKRETSPAPTGRSKAASGKTLQRKAAGPAEPGLAPPVVHEALNSPGQPLDKATREFFELRFGHDFSRVRVHADSEAAESARVLHARAYTVGSDVVLAQGQSNAASQAGRELLAHELVHVVQQRGHSKKTATQIREPAAGEAQEAEADLVANAVLLGTSPPRIGDVEAVQLQRKVEMRDVGRGQQSGFARLPELVTRLNAMSQGLTFSVSGGNLTYIVRPGGTLSGFDNQMRSFIDQVPLIPLRLTNRHGLLGDPIGGFNQRVEEDAWSSGYVDIDDLLASTDLGLQSVLVHFLRERTATPNYARRIGSPSLDTSLPGPAHEFTRAHAQGIRAELQLLRDYFGDPTIRVVTGAESGDIFRVYRNSRRDRIRTRVRQGRGAQAGVDAASVEVVTRDGVTRTPEDYRAILEAERAARQVEQERLRGATEYREGGRSVPAP